jgi:hypothetical protein
LRYIITAVKKTKTGTGFQDIIKARLNFLERRRG